VLFCDLVGSTEIAAQLDPEEWRDLVASYHRAAAHAITRYGGHVAKYMGDGVMAYFGWPEAHENEAERAARAGLAILEEVSKFNQLSAGLTISVRVGIDSGAVVIGAGAGKEADVFGEAPNIAARVQSAAASNSVLITAATHRLLSGLFVVEQSGTQQLKGLTAPVELYRVVRPTGIRSRIAVRDLTPFVGRTEELNLLLSRWEHAREGDGQAVLVVGEAGIGKSRLVSEFHDRICDTPHIWMESAGEQFFENTPFHAVSEMLSRWLELQSGEGREEQFKRLEHALGWAGLKVEETAPLISDLLQLPVGERYPLLKLTPEEKRRRLLSALAAWAFGAARLQPLVMVVEDLHWLDPSTLDSQQLLVEQGATVPLMLLYTARPEFHAPWSRRAHHTQITLNRLSARNVRELISRVAALTALADETVDAVVERTSGVPLFVEELTRAVLESGTTNSRVSEIPVTLHDSLMARLDRLGPAKEVVQIGAVIGPEFSYELLHAVHPISERDLQAALRSVTDAELIYAQGLAPDAIYQFKHALIRDAAYEALLKSRRKDLHRHVAQTIDEEFPTLKETHPEVLARHWAEAGETERAIRERQLAGERAYARSAMVEAERHYSEAFDLLHEHLPESPERDRLELTLRQSAFPMVGAKGGYVGPESILAVEQAFALAEKSGNVAQQVNWLTARGVILLLSGELVAADTTLERVLELAAQYGIQEVSRIHRVRILTRYWRGDLVGSERHFAAWIADFGDPLICPPRAINDAVNGLAFASYNAWLLGLAEIARQREAQMFAVANRGSPYEVSNAGYCGSRLELYLRNYERARDLSAHALELAEKYQLPDAVGRSRCSLGTALVYLGRVAACQ
jgi:class 3 adenylate cyclase